MNTLPGDRGLFRIFFVSTIERYRFFLRFILANVKALDIIEIFVEYAWSICRERIEYPF